jgi:transposase-like protein
MKRSRLAIFRRRHFEFEIIATCVRWYLRFSLSLRNVEEMMAERGLMRRIGDDVLQPASL